MNDNTEKDNKIVTPFKIILPIIIGVGVVIWLFMDDLKSFDWHSINFSSNMMLWLLLSFICIFGRELGYMMRFRILSNRDLSWRQSFDVTMLCEFSSTITPTAVGGSSLAMIFMKKEGINVGRGTTIVLTTLFLDELFMVISCPIVLMITPLEKLFSSVSNEFSVGIYYVFWGIYIGVVLWTITLFLGVIKPHFVKSILLKIFSLRILKRWKTDVSDMGDNMILASNDVKAKNLKWWCKAFGATAFSWISRYLMVSTLFIAFIGWGDKWLIFARQAVMWIILMVSPTPGGSGVSEWLFTEYYADLVPIVGIALIIALAWRILSFYLYLFSGMIIVPLWLRKRKRDRLNHN